MQNKEILLVKENQKMNINGGNESKYHKDLMFARNKNNELMKEINILQSSLKNVK